MPIFMDRHDISNVTAEEVAAAHAEDLKIQDKFGCRALTYWFDEERGAAFCLIEAPEIDAVRSMHGASHGLVPTEIIEVEPGKVTSFLGRMADPVGSDEQPIRESAFRAIMFTDMARSTDITNQLGDHAAFEVLQKHHEIVCAALDRHEGREVDRAGDGFLTCFSSAQRAVECAIDIQKDFDEYNRSGSGPVKIQIRVGLGAGEPVTYGERLFGSTINLTARICSYAKPEQVVAARVIRQLCAGKKLRFKELGSTTLKGFQEPVQLDEVVWRG